MRTITAQIKREWLDEILAKRKRVEYRNTSDFWNKRLDGLETPFRLRLINGMRKRAPEAIVSVDKLVKNRSTRQYEFHLGRIIERKNI
jgi:hypothetical protein